MSLYSNKRRKLKVNGNGTNTGPSVSHWPQTSLQQVSEAYASKLPPNEQDQYFMDSMHYLLNDDLQGWMEKFQQPMAVPRERGNRIKHVPFPPCKECKKEVMEDVIQGYVVCLHCGLVANSCVLVPDVYVTVDGMDKKVTARVVDVHQYCRLAYFRSMLLGLMGGTTPTITAQELAQITQHCIGQKKTELPFITSKQVVRAIKTLYLPNRHKRHATRIAYLVSNGNCDILTLGGEDVSRLLKAFRMFECEWDRLRHNKCNTKRVYFMNYRCCAIGLCAKLKIPHTIYPLKSSKVHAENMRVFERVCARLSFSNI